MTELEAPVGTGTTRRRQALLRLLTLVALLAVPLRVVGYGWLPQDDVRRHAAKVISGKPWSEILVLRPEAALDEHPGWHALLGAVHRAGVDSPRTLAVVSVVALAGLFLVAPLTRLRVPEAWLAALALVSLFDPAFFPRLLIGRPLVLAMALLALLVASWEDLAPPPPARLWRAGWAGVALLFALAVWVYGNWYLWLLPLAAFFVAGQRRLALRLGVACVAGAILGATLTGHPVAFLEQSVQHLYWSLGSPAPAALLATEFQPGVPSPALLLAVGLLLLWRRGARARPLGEDPVFLLAAGGWLLGFMVFRTWSDWGEPALLVWTARELEALWTSRTPSFPQRALAVALTAFVLVMSATGNRNDRWGSYETENHLRQDDPALAGWLPDPGGILYSNSMGLFYDTFFGNPRADFRYVLGFEPGLMPPEELAIFRGIQSSGKADASFLPWVAKLRPSDRLIVVRQGGQPQIPALEWYAPFPSIWIGRLPRR